MKKVYYFIFLTFITSITILYTREEPFQADSSTQQELLSKIDAFLEKISDDSVLRVIALQEKRKILEALLKAQEVEPKEYMPSLPNNNQSLNTQFDIFTTPVRPKSLTEAEQKESVLKRIQEQFIGDIPAPIKRAIFYFEYHKECLEKGIRSPGTILLHGIPGVGKTHLVDVLAQELQLPMFSFPAAAFSDKFIGETAHHIRKVFTTAAALNKPIIIFIDEIDALATKRQATTHEEHKAALTTLLTEIQKADIYENILIIIATNDLNALDSAIKDRFPAKCCIKKLTQEQRAALLMKLFKDEGLEANQELAGRLAHATQEYETWQAHESMQHLATDEQKGSWRERHYSNRDLKYLVRNAKAQQLIESESEAKNNIKHTCLCFCKVLKEMSESEEKVRGKKSLNCNGI